MGPDEAPYVEDTGTPQDAQLTFGLPGQYVYKVGDVLSFPSFDSVGYLTAGFTSVRFLVPLRYGIDSNVSNVRITGTGFILRQNGRYTHGSAASTPVMPTANAIFKNASGFELWVSFPADTSAQNNSCIAVSFGPASLEFI